MIGIMHVNYNESHYATRKSNSIVKAYSLQS